MKKARNNRDIAESAAISSLSYGMVIKAIEAGMPRSVIAYHYGVSRAAISKWMRDHSSKEYRALNKRHKASVKENAELAAYDPIEMKGTSTGLTRFAGPGKGSFKKGIRERS